MASEDKKTNPPSKSEAVPKKETVPKKEAAPADKSGSDTAPSKADAGEKTAAAPTGYSRGEGQKPVTQAYKDNWNAIFAKKKNKNKKR